ncbi:hypothetical protein HF325_000907 [Metschnikowia pulcherrima]|uniref:Hypoxia up-regulated 1 n=1 Tax=Metschnikowia pulcherrima TaxID=27326 RepID=A0A8H7GX85_9ASCO|nr:hypothetical protein HF325_000907 [Metschnikowia pulcherrima]
MKLLSTFYAWSIVSAAIVGVDFGHKFTKAMMVAPGIHFEIIPTDGGNRKDLSAIYVDPKVSEGSLENAERAYGSQIGSLCSRSPETCAANLKSLLGKTIEDPWVKQYMQQNPQFRIVAGKERPNAISFELGRSGSTFTFSVEELAAMSLAELKERVIKALTHHPQARAIAEDVAISIPPFANQFSRLAYRDALSLANYSSVLGLVDEGCAAALAYVSDRKFANEEYDGKKVHQIIYDVGAGSTTATLFSITPFQNGSVYLDVESVGYDDTFGGELLTKKVYDILYEKFLEKFDLDKSYEMPFRLAARLYESAEKAKTILSANADSKVSLESFWNEEDFKTVISRQEFEEASTQLIERVVKPISDALENSPTGPKTIADVESVILNGGATRTPFIQKKLIEHLGEGKLSKVLNADEACAYGTTIRAYQLKTITTSGTDIILNDRILSDFEISLNSSSEKRLVFAKGSTAGTKSLVNLGQVTGDRISIGLHENNQFYGSYNVTRLSSRASDLTCPANDVSLYADFALGEDKIFYLDSLFVNCTSSDIIPESQIDDKNTTSSNSTTKRVAKTKSRVMVPSISYSSLRPYNSTEKKRFMASLSHLKELEKDKIVLEHTRNVLEGTCYSLRFYIDDHYDVLLENLGESVLEEYQTKAGDMIDWVDYESGSLTLKEIEEKLNSVKEIRQALESTVKMLDSDLSLSTLEDLLAEGTELAQSVQDYLLEFGNQTKQVRDKYESENFDFETENEKIMKKIYGVGQKEQFDLEKHFLDFKQALKELTEMVGLSKSKFEDLASQEKFEVSETVSSLTREMVNDVQILQKQHEQRITYLLTRLEKLKERKEQKLLKAKLKSEKEKEKEKEKENSELTQVEVPEFESTTVASQDSATSTAIDEHVEDATDQPKETKPYEDHDEL